MFPEHVILLHNTTPGITLEGSITTNDIPSNLNPNAKDVKDFIILCSQSGGNFHVRPIFNNLS